MNWRRHLHISKARLLIRGGAVLCLVGALTFLWALPTFLRVDFFRHEIAGQLEKEFGRHISLGPLYAQILPRPGLVATDVVMFDPQDAHLPMARIGRIVLIFHGAPLLRLKLEIKDVFLEAPRCLVKRREKDWSDLKRSLALPEFSSTEPGTLPLEKLFIRDGEIDWTDSTLDPPLSFQVTHVALRYEVQHHRGTLEGRALWLGPDAFLQGIYLQESSIPLHLSLGRISTRFLKPYFPHARSWLDGSVQVQLSLHREARDRPAFWAIMVQQWRTAALSDIGISGALHIRSDQVWAEFRSINTQPLMRLHTEVSWHDQGIHGNISLLGLAPMALRDTALPIWLARLEGLGKLDGTFHYMHGQSMPLWEVHGEGFNLKGTSLHMERILCQQDGLALRVHVEAIDQKGRAIVDWARPEAGENSNLQVVASSITVGQIMDVFELRSHKPSAESYQNLEVHRGMMRARIIPDQQFEIKQADMQVEEGMLHLVGYVNTAQKPSQASFKGTIRRLPLAQLTMNFTNPTLKSSLVSFARYDIHLPLATVWYKKMIGTVSARVRFPWVADIAWSRPSAIAADEWTVDASSLTVRDILSVFALEQPSSVRKQDSSWKWYGYEDLMLNHVHVRGRTLLDRRVDILKSRLRLENGSLDIAGRIDIQAHPPLAAFHGSIENLPVERAALRFWPDTPTISGDGRANFDLEFPLSRQWVTHLNGQIAIHIENGVLAILKNTYKIMAFTNLTNYLSFRFPNSSTQGIPFSLIDGHLTFQKGILRSDDLFLSSRDMKIAASGSLDLSHRIIHAVVKFQVFRFLENLVTHIPGIHEIFKDGRRILLPVPVKMDGPLNDVTLS